jgi:hypothetical protein
MPRKNSYRSTNDDIATPQHFDNQQLEEAVERWQLPGVVLHRRGASRLHEITGQIAVIVDDFRAASGQNNPTLCADLHG